MIANTRVIRKKLAFDCNLTLVFAKFGPSSFESWLWPFQHWTCEKHAGRAPRESFGSRV